MKIINANTIHRESIQSDVCIIGAGPAGVTLASKLAYSNLDVMIVESGGKKSDETVNRLNKLKVESNFNYRDDESRRNRQIGGTANLWVGRVVPVLFDPVLDAEWGELKDAVLPFYDEAFRFFGIDPKLINEYQSSEEELVAYWAHKTERFNSESKLVKENQDVRIYQFLTCIGEPALNGDRITQLLFVNKKQERVAVQSKCFVFAMGAIENSRMLLLIQEQVANGINQYLSNVGKYVMDHPRVWHGKIETSSDSVEIDKYQLKTTDYGIYKTGIRNQPDGTRVYSNLMKPVNRTTILLNRIPSRSFQVSSKRLILREKGLLRMLANEKSKFPLIRQMTSFKNLLQEFFNHDNSRSYFVMSYCEQRPRKNNLLTLAEERDENGLRIPKLINNLHEDELTEVLSFFEFLKERVSQMGGSLDYDPKYLSNPLHYTDASHIMGGTRFSSIKEKAVVDKKLSVSGFQNLYITGSSVFPTSGVENPTHLIVSLSCYLANALKQRI